LLKANMMKNKGALQKKIIPVIFSVLFFIPFYSRAQTEFSVTHCQTEQKVIALIDTVLFYNVDTAFKQNITFTGNPKSLF